MYDREDVELALYALEEGMTRREAGELVGASGPTVSRWALGRVPHARGEGGRRIPRDGTRRREEGPVTDEERAAYEAAMTENMLLRAVLDDLKAEGCAPATMSNRRKAELGERLRAATGLPLREITAFLRILKSSYEYHRARLGEQGDRERWGDEVERIFREEGACARGYRFVHARLAEVVAAAGRPRAVSEKVVRDVMAARGLRVVYAKKAKRYSSYAGEPDDAPGNIPLDEATGRHDFKASAPDEKWVSDITEFRLPDDPRKVYLSLVADLYDSKPVGWSVGLRPDAELANSSLLKACARLAEGGPRPFVHTDRGCHYRWPGWKGICEENGLERSMSRKGRSPDNAACEGFFGRLKNEFFHGRDWSGVAAEEFMARLDAWMRFYSEGRLRAFRVDGKTVYDTIDHRREVLGLAA